MDLSDIRSKLDDLPAKDLAELQRQVLKAVPDLWVPNPGPQLEAMRSPADELFFGGGAGGGKSALVVGLAVTKHERSIIYRRQYTDLGALVDEAVKVVGHADGLNRSPPPTFRLPDRTIQFAAMAREEDKQAYKGRPFDLVAFDELADFSESQYTFVIGWNRSTKPGQRCRVIATGNPPTTVEGLWVIKRWAPWLDPKHPKPARSGELRWFASIDGEDTEVFGPGPVYHPKTGDIILNPATHQPVLARSRTFIRSMVADNPDLMDSGYANSVAAMPEPYRSAYLEGRFDLSLKDDEAQVIPTRWVMEAQQRWSPDTPFGLIPMTVIGCDPNGGGRDRCILAPRYGGYYLPLIEVKGIQVDDASVVVREVAAVMRDRCPVVMDMGGGYGGLPTNMLRSNGLAVIGYNGAGESRAHTRDAAHLAFYNKRAEAIWRLREALDPAQPGGSPVVLPPDDELRADLCAPRFELTRQGIKIESKDSIRERIGRSPDKGDAVVMAWSEGERASAEAVVARNREWGITPRGQQPTANRGYTNIKRSHS